MEGKGMRGIRNIKLKVVNRKRFITFISCTLVIISTLFITFISQTSVSGQAKNNYIHVNVVAGDTLWDIAQKYNHNHKDIRKFINEIMIENNMETAMINQGETIKVPIK
jgi:LysM repeat protein